MEFRILRAWPARVVTLRLPPFPPRRPSRPCGRCEQRPVDPAEHRQGELALYARPIHYLLPFSCPVTGDLNGDHIADLLVTITGGQPPAGGGILGGESHASGTSGRSSRFWRRRDHGCGAGGHTCRRMPGGIHSPTSGGQSRSACPTNTRTAIAVVRSGRPNSRSMFTWKGFGCLGIGSPIQTGRPRLLKNLRQLIRKIGTENPQQPGTRRAGRVSLRLPTINPSSPNADSEGWRSAVRTPRMASVLLKI